MRNRRIGLDQILALAYAIVECDDHGDLRGQSIRLAYVGVVAAVLDIGIVKAKRGDGRAENIHRGCVFGELPQQGDHGGIDLAFLAELLAQVVEFGLLRETSVPKQKTGFFKRRMLPQLTNVDATIGQNSKFAVDVTNAGIGSDDAFQTLAWGSCPGGHVYPLSACLRVNAKPRMRYSRVGSPVRGTPG